MTNKQNAIGVIVGRFQVHKLTEGHKEILDFVLSQNHYMNILVLGNPPRDVRCTKNNPLPYVSRKRMIEEEYPGKFEICYKTDVMSDEESAKNGWSSENWAFGMGGGLLQKINRDTCRFAFKCSAQKYDDK